MHTLSLDQPPFDLLSEQDRALLQRHGEVIYLANGEILPKDMCHDFFVVIKGALTQRCTGKESLFHQANDWFLGNEYADVYSNESTLLYKIARQAINTVCTRNDDFAALFSHTLRERRYTQQTDYDNEALMLCKVKEAYLRKPVFIQASASIVEATQAMHKVGQGHVLVHHHKRIGIFSNSNLSAAVMAGVNLHETEVGEFAQFRLITIDENSELSEALQKMVANRIHRLPVTNEQGQIIATLGQTDLMSFFTNHSHLIALDIEQANSIEELHRAADQIGPYIRSQYERGIRVNIIGSMVQTLNLQIFKRLWQLIAPAEIIANTCVFVMGSEGRGEQILRTDQDNGLIIANGFEHPRLDSCAKQFNTHLAQMGYPLCDGNIMMKNPLWRQNVTDFCASINQWLSLSNEKDMIYLSTFADATYVCGQEQLLKQLHQHLHQRIARKPTGLIHQCMRAALQFGDTQHWWQKFLPGGEQNDLDLKKAGIFPIVHGIRTLALEHTIAATSTKMRLQILAEQEHLDANLALNLSEALDFFISQRLKTTLAASSKSQRQGVNPTTMSAMERDVLKHSLNIVREFKAELTGRYHLDRM